MQAVSNLRTASFLFFDQLNRSRPAAAGPMGSLLPGGKTIEAKPSLSFASDSIYSINHVDANKLKINLAERLAKAFDLDFKAFKDMGGLVQAVERELEKLDPKAAMEMELAVGKELGLDELGLTFRELLKALTNPGSEEDRKLTAALVEDAENKEDSGLYGPR